MGTPSGTAEPYDGTKARLYSLQSDPAAVSHSEFWHRYFYKVHQLEQEQARRDALKQRAEQSISEEPGWEEEEEELMGISPISPKEAKVPVAKISTFPEGEPGPQSPCEENLVTSVEPPAEVTPSESSESISLVTQIANPATAPEARVLPKDLSQISSANQSSGHRFWWLPAGPLGPLLTPGKGLSKSRPETLTCANNRMTQGRGNLSSSPEEPVFFC
uniref:cDNA FLJ57704, moderately similar to Homo sapiens BSD domain containing 1 (BSDC1), mRNA n=1 Tax=Homo sapiens TaxID=9606 RepID=B4DE39_HUMAN|nr:unnamed protein product [Homo sapiens]